MGHIIVLQNEFLNSIINFFTNLQLKCEFAKWGNWGGKCRLHGGELTHPDEATPVFPSLRLRRIEGQKEIKNELHPLCGGAGERVGQRSVAGVSRASVQADICSD